MVPASFTLSLLAIIPAILSAVQAADAEPSSTDKNATATASSMCLMFEDQFEKFNLAHWKVKRMHNFLYKKKSLAHPGCRVINTKYFRSMRSH
jgi:hypothetical protein